MQDMVKIIFFALLIGVVIGAGTAFAGKQLNFEVSHAIIGGIIGGIVGLLTVLFRAKKSNSDKTD
jgi:membrane associated rhomboid family serine protease